MNRQIWAVLAAALIAISLSVLVTDDSDGSSVSPDSFEVKYSGYNTYPTSGTVSVDGDTVTIDFSYRTVGGKQQVDSVDWGDGTVDVPKSGQEDMTIVKSSGLTLTHTYAQNGTYTVTIDGHRWSYSQKSYIWDTVTVSATIDSIVEEVGEGDIKGSGTQSDPYVYNLEAGKRYELSLPPVGTSTKWYPAGSAPVSIPGMLFSSSSGETDYIDASGFGTGQLGNLTLSGTPTTDGEWSLYAYNPSATAYYRIVVTGGDALTEIQSMTISGPSTIEEGVYATYTVNISPSSASSKVVQWSTDSPYNLIDDETNTSCRLYGIYETGTITLTASAMDGSGKTASKVITVIVPPPTLSFNANGGTGAPSAIQSDEYELESYTYTIPSGEPSRAGYRFLGWSTDRDATVADPDYDAGRQDTLTSSRTLYAVWEEALNEIASVSDLRNISMNGQYELTEDITISGSWTPIGSESSPFNGILDGNGHTISITSSSPTAIFGCIGSNGEVRNLAVDASIIVTDSKTVTRTASHGTFSYDYEAAALALINQGKIWKCFITGTVSVTSSITTEQGGGITEDGPSVTISMNVGGLVADNRGTVIVCYGNAVVSGAASIHTTRDTGLLLSKGSAYLHVGGLVGESTSMVAQSYFVGQVSETVSITSTSADGITAEDMSYAGAITGYGGTTSGCYFLSGSVTGTDSGYGSSKSSAELRQQSTFSGWDFDDVWIMDGYPRLQSMMGAVSFTSTAVESTVPSGQLFTYTPTATPDGATISIVKDETGCMSMVSGVLRGTLTGLSPGTYHVTLQASYGSMTPATQVVTIHVPVTIITPAEYSVYTGTNWVYDPETDPEGAEITIVSVQRNGSVVTDHGITVSDGVISGTFSQTGTWTVTFKASYETFEPTNKTVTIIVSEAPVVEEKPTLSGIVFAQHYGQDRMFYFAASGADHYVTSSWDFGDGTSDVTNTLSTVHRFPASGLYDVTLTLANTAGETVERTVSVLVTDESYKNDAWIGVKYSAMVEIDASATPTLSGVSWLSVEKQEFDGRTYAIVTGTPTDTGLAGQTVHVKLTAGTLTEEWDIQIHAKTSTKPTAIFDVETDYLEVTLTFSGQNASRVFIDWGEGDGFERQSSVKGPFTHTYDGAGIYTVRVQVDNNNGSVTGQKEVTVTERVEIDVSFGDIADQELSVGQEFSMTIVTEPADAVLSFSGADWLSLDGHTLSGVPVETGDYVITLTAKYADADPEQATFAITVTGGDEPGPDGPDDPDEPQEAGGPDWLVFGAVAAVAAILAIASRNAYVVLICAGVVIVAAFVCGVV